MELLQTLRVDPTSWQSVAFVASESAERGTYDSHECTRFRVLLALQYDRRESDVELVRFLFTNEIVAAENDSSHGSASALQLAAFLLARFHEPADTLLFARAKVANFDTACGFPTEFICLANGEKTGDYLRRHSSELWDRLQSFDVSYSQDELQEWWQSICDEYPASEDEEHLLALYERALVFDEKTLAEQYLAAWAEGEPDSDAKQTQLKYEYVRLGEFKSAAQIASRIAEKTMSLWDRASALTDLIKLNRQAGEFTQSFNSVFELDSTLAAFDDWIGVGLGRMTIHEVFELAICHPVQDDARMAFKLADTWFQRSHDLALIGMEAARKAAGRCGLSEKLREYENMAAIERERIKNVLK